MTFFYNITGLLIWALAFFAYRLGGLVDKSRQEFRLAIRLLSLAYLLSGLSLFISPFDPGVELYKFNILNPLMLLFFYLISHTFAYIVLILYQASDGAFRRFRQLMWQMLGLFGTYGIFYIFMGDEFIYSADQVIARLSNSPMFLFRVGLLITTLGSLMYNIYACNEAGKIYIKHVTKTFSETDYQRSIVISKFMWNLKALAIWVLLTYFYSTPILEIVSCSLMLIVFALQYNDFRGYILHRNSLIF